MFLSYKYQVATYIKTIDIPEKQNVTDSTFLPLPSMSRMIILLNVICL